MSSNIVRGEKPGNYLPVEGDDDEHVFYSLLEHYKVPDQFKIENKKGVNKLIDELDAELDRSGLARLGIVVDADIDLKDRFRDVYESKARIHTWLAWQKEPGKPLGQAITARYLDADAPHAQQLMDWIRKLFDLETA